jgi:hypothetical protein
MNNAHLFSCDGCGQTATPEHIARRLRCLECATRYRPVHINTLLLGAFSPASESGFLYGGILKGEAAALLDAVGISWNGKSADSVLAEFQRSGLFLTHILECPLEPGLNTREGIQAQLAQHLPAVVTRIRRSLKPKRVVLFSRETETILSLLSGEQLGCPLILDEGKPLLLDSASPTGRLRKALEAAASTVNLNAQM